MPRYIIEIPRVHDAITRPIVKHVTDEVLKNFGFHEDNVQLVFNGLNEAVSINNSVIDQEERHLRLKSDQRIEVNFDEEVVNPLEVAMLRQEQRPIFSDLDLRTYIKPVYVSCKVDVNIKLIAMDQTTAQMWKRRAELQSYREMHQFITDVDYHYIIPKEVIRQLWVIHTLRERSNKPKDEELGTWFKRCFHPRMRTIHDQAGNNMHIAIAERQSRVQCWFTFGHDVTKINRHDEASAWETEFTVTFFYDRADAVVIDYPLVIHNQLIPSDYRDDTPAMKDWEDSPTERSLSLNTIGRFEYKGLHYHPSPISGIAIPKFDDWLHKYQLNDHWNINRILVGLDPEDLTYLINLEDDMGDYAINAHSLAYLKDLGELMFSAYDTLYHVTLHEWWELIDQKSLTVDGLKLYCKHELDETCMYHLVVNLLLDLSKISDTGWDILKRHPDVLEDFFDKVRPGDKDKIPRKPDGSYDWDKYRDGVKKTGNTTPPDWTDGVKPIGRPYEGPETPKYVNGFNIFVYRKGVDKNADYDGLKESQ